jgi:hypothetical protein
MLPLGSLLGCRSYDVSLLHATDHSDQDAGALPPGCGNGVVAGDELCDIGIPSGTEGACPSTCTSEDPCVQMALVGADCEAQCLSIPITAAMSDDGCCPPDVGAAEDSDCGFCGDEIVGPSEICDPPGTCPTREECSQTSACIFGIYVGDPGQCNAFCRAGETTDCENSDGCCPADCNTETDDDCSPRCGDGVIQAQAGETCEPDDVSVPCPESCDDSDPCTTDSRTGDASNCDVVCSHAAVTALVNGDGCCVPQGTMSTDSDCSTVIHRYPFTGSGTTVADSVGSSDGTVVGDSLDGDGKVTLAGGTSEAYVDLPNGIVSSLTNATFEAWVTWTNTTEDHVRIFDFGSSTGEGVQAMTSTGYLYLTGGWDTNRHLRGSFSRDGTSVPVLATSTAQFPASGIHHVALVFDDTNDRLEVYLDGASVASMALTPADHLSALTDNNNWLGRAQFVQDDEFAGSFHEFRIYNTALTGTEVMASYTAGSEAP